MKSQLLPGKKLQWNQILLMSKCALYKTSYIIIIVPQTEVLIIHSIKVNHTVLINSKL